MLETLAQSDEDLAEEIRALLFTFEDIVKLDDRALQSVLKGVEDADLTLALRGVPDEVREKVLANVSERRSELLVEEIEYQPPQRKSVVEEAQSRVVAEVRRLEEEGDLTIGTEAAMSSSFEFPELAVPRPVEERLAAAEAAARGGAGARRAPRATTKAWRPGAPR